MRDLQGIQLAIFWGWTLRISARRKKGLQTIMIRHTCPVHVPSIDFWLTPSNKILGSRHLSPPAEHRELFPVSQSLLSRYSVVIPIVIPLVISKTMASTANRRLQQKKDSVYCKFLLKHILNPDWEMRGDQQ